MDNKGENIEDLLKEEDDVDALYRDEEGFIDDTRKIEIDKEDLVDEVNAREDIKEDDLKDPKDNKKLFIIIGAVVGALLLIILLVVLLGGGKKSDSNKKEEEKQEKEKQADKKDEDEDEEDKRERIPRTEKKMAVYLINGKYVEDSYVKEEDRKGKLAIRMDIEDLDAKVLDVYPDKTYGKSEYPTFILFKDNGKIKYFSIKTVKSTTTSMDAKYNKYSILAFNDSIKAIYYKKNKENGIYNIATKKYLYKNSYKDFKVVGDNLMEAVKDDKTYTLAISQEKVVSDSTGDSETENMGNFTVRKKDGIYTIYDKNFNELGSGVEKRHVYAEGNTVYIAKKDGIIYQYDINGKMVKKSVPFDEILLVTNKGFIASVGDKIIIDKYANLSNDINKLEIVYGLGAYTFKVEYSGYKSESDKTEKKGNGIYAFFEGVQVSKEIFYDVDSGAITETKLSS